jgi:hypothetical protein
MDIAYPVTNCSSSSRSSSFDLPAFAADNFLLPVGCEISPAQGLIGSEPNNFLIPLYSSLWVSLDESKFWTTKRILKSTHAFAFAVPVPPPSYPQASMICACLHCRFQRRLAGLQNSYNLHTSADT